ncbi:NUDIX domain-containing protein [Nitrospinae bacterium]|nr:NUDIX domain-containing protein [Nitrospinota bacterium]
MPPYGWALPGGFIDYGKPLKISALWEAFEEAGGGISIRPFNIYSDPDHNFLQHNISTVFVGQATGEAKTGSDTQKAGLFYKNTLSALLVFDHVLILKYYYYSRAGLGQLKL